MRIILAALSLGLLAGCANSPPLSNAHGNCYLLVKGKTPVAEVCEHGSRLRYHEILPGDAAYEIPAYVQAVLQVHGYLEKPAEVPSAADVKR